MNNISSLISRVGCIALFAAVLGACGQQESATTSNEPVAQAEATETTGEPSQVSTNSNATTNLYWGDTHLHTKLSVDAFLMQERTLGPDAANRYAKEFYDQNSDILPFDRIFDEKELESMGLNPKWFEY